jgi:LuxR family maltose regulon positive regulatory protein
MPTPILATKLYLPLPRPGLVSRPRLVERLNAGLDRNLSLISAAAGFGKTTLLSEWITACGRPVAWLSLDETDSDIYRFITYVLAALQTVQPALGESLFAVLQTSQPPPAESLLSGLLNEIAALPGRYLLILDDYHLLDSPAVDSALVFLLDYLPPQLHLVIAGREDPNLPLARLRARGQLTELRAANLRFTSAEASEFLNRMMGLNLPEEQIAAIESRTEGWIAGLQLAALAMQGEQDTARFIQSFTGSHRFVLDYLLEEVLNQQPQSIQDFLLRTSIISIRLDLAQDDHRIPHIFR